jgi:hypothetical protein
MHPTISLFRSGYLIVRKLVRGAVTGAGGAHDGPQALTPPT